MKYFDVLKQYGLSEIDDITELTGGTANCNFKISTGKTSYVLREKSSRYSKISDIKYEYECLRKLDSKNVTVPVPLKNNKGFIYTKTAGKVYQLFRYIPHKKSNCIIVAAKTLADFHNALWNFKSSYLRDRQQFDTVDYIVGLYEDIKDMLTVGQKIQYKMQIEVFEQALEYLKDKEVDKEMPRIVIHGDFHPGNFGATGNLGVLFDFDCMSRQYRLRDIADGMMFFCSTRKKPFNTGNIKSLVQSFVLNKEKCKSFIKTYNRHINIKITKSEMEFIKYFAIARFLNCRVEGARKVKRNEIPSLVFNECDVTLENLFKYENR